MTVDDDFGVAGFPANDVGPGCGDGVALQIADVEGGFDAGIGGVDGAGEVMRHRAAGPGRHDHAARRPRDWLREQYNIARLTCSGVGGRKVP